MVTDTTCLLEPSAEWASESGKCYFLAGDDELPSLNDLHNSIEMTRADWVKFAKFILSKQVERALHEHYLPGNSTEAFVWSSDDGRMWVGIGPHKEQVNYCPICGELAAIRRANG
jgi:hypothetical protein